VKNNKFDFLATSSSNFQNNCKNNLKKNLSDSNLGPKNPKPLVTQEFYFIFGTKKGFLGPVYMRGLGLIALGDQD
jgi:hypothetical protein